MQLLLLKEGCHVNTWPHLVHIYYDRHFIWSLPVKPPFWKGWKKSRNFFYHQKTTTKLLISPPPHEREQYFDKLQYIRHWQLISNQTLFTNNKYTLFYVRSIKQWKPLNQSLTCSRYKFPVKCVRHNWLIEVPASEKKSFSTNPKKHRTERSRTNTRKVPSALYYVNFVHEMCFSILSW